MSEHLSLTYIHAQYQRAVAARDDWKLTLLATDNPSSRDAMEFARRCAKVEFYAEQLAVADRG